MDLAFLESGRLVVHKSATDIVTLFQRITQQRRINLRAKNIRVELPTETQPEFELDAEMMTRVFENLYDNALRCTPAGGQIRIDVDANRQSLVVKFGNSGPAIPVEMRDAVFDKFRQGERGAGGMNLGLGLYFCRLAVEAHGGTIAVEQTAALPTVFVLRFPRSEHVGEPERRLEDTRRCSGVVGRLFCLVCRSPSSLSDTLLVSTTVFA
jgi:two-component system heavy metal sensor histidine kinase CusS